jgi:uncharacterized protein
MAATAQPSVARRIATELGVTERQVVAAVELLDAGSTVPFIARYRKEATGSLDDSQLRTLEERLTYLRELDARRTAILDSIREQGKLDAGLEAQLREADTKARLEDLYLPFKPKRRSKAQAAREAGLEPLALGLLADPSRDPEAVAAGFVAVDRGIADTAAALEGARAILVERLAEDAALIGRLREEVWTKGRMVSTVRDGKQAAGDFMLKRPGKMRFDYDAPITDFIVADATAAVRLEDPQAVVRLAAPVLAHPLLQP